MHSGKPGVQHVKFRRLFDENLLQYVRGIVRCCSSFAINRFVRGVLRILWTEGGVCFTSGLDFDEVHASKFSFYLNRLRLWYGEIVKLIVIEMSVFWYV